MYITVKKSNIKFYPLFLWIFDKYIGTIVNFSKFIFFFKNVIYLDKIKCYNI